MSNASFKSWLINIKKIQPTDLDQSMRDSLYVEYLQRNSSGRSKGKERKGNAKVRAAKASNVSQEFATERSKWVINYLGYDYKSATNSQRRYFDDDYARYIARDSFNVMNITEEEWAIKFAPDMTNCSDEMQLNAHREYEWFVTSLWEYEPMSFQTFLEIFKGLAFSKFLVQATSEQDALYSEYYDFLHDCARACEDIWIDKLDSVSVLNKLLNKKEDKAQQWANLGIATDADGNPVKCSYSGCFADVH